jgi:hypothetical protein
MASFMGVMMLHSSAPWEAELSVLSVLFVLWVLQVSPRVRQVLVVHQVLHLVHL